MKSVLLFDEDLSLKTIRIGLIEAKGLRWPRSVVASGAEGSPGGEQAVLDPRFAGIVQSVGARGLEAISASRKSAVRDMLRYGRYKPAGRAKPSSEYLLQVALESDFPAVNFFVDAVNIVSLVSGYPISIVDQGKAGFEFLLRRAREGENYIFNPVGQSIDLTDLLCVCRETEGGFVPTANPVRDSMATKLFPGADAAVAFIYAPEGAEGHELEDTCRSLAGYLEEFAENVCWTLRSAYS